MLGLVGGGARYGLVVDGSTHFRQRSGEEQRATWLELFFDLVFVFAVTQLSHLLLHHLTLGGALQTVLLLLVVWWAWIYTTWMTNWFDPDSVLVRLVLLMVMASSLLMAVAIPEAFGRLAPLFACAYVALQVVRNAFNVYATPRENEFHIVFHRILVWSLASGALWLAGGFASRDARTWLWIAALAADYLAPSLGYWTPRLGRSATTDWEIETAHFAERFQLFIIIALGESIVVTGATASSPAFDLVIGTSLMVAFATSAALWWLYFDEVGWRAQRFLSRADDSGKLARDAYTYLHVPIVAGIIVIAVADEVVIAHPGSSPSTVELAVILGGPALYLIGHTLFRLRMIRNVSRKRLAAAVAIVALTPLGAVLTSLGLAACVLAILTVLAVAETRNRLGDTAITT
jgi:low temperature requirement protein LtrA